VSQSEVPTISRSIGNKLAWPILIGTAMTVVFYSVINFGALPQHWLMRYVTAHPVEYVEVTMFFIGVAALLLKAGSLFGEFRSAHQVELAASNDQPFPVSHVPSLLHQLDEASGNLSMTRLFQRLKKGLLHVHSSQSAAGLSDEMKYLADIDQERCEHDYSLVRIVVWATPMLGFLGTVIGITLALGNLSPEALVNEPKVAMESLLQGLSVAFDTTALALTLSIALMFAQFILSRVEADLLISIDQMASDELLGRFETEGSSTDPNVQVIRHMSEKTVQATQDLLVRQTELWRETINSAHQQWQRLASGNVEQLETAIQSAISKSLEQHEALVAGSQSRMLDASKHQLNEVVHALESVNTSIQGQHDKMSNHSDILLKVVQATGEVASLEESLNRNLSALAGKQHFEETVQSLAAAIHLLNSRISQTSRPSVQLDSDKGQAA